MRTAAAFGIEMIVYREVYSKDETAISLAEEFGIALEQLPD